MNYEDLTKRIEKAKETRDRAIASLWWDGYIAALNDIRNDMNTGGEKGGSHGKT